MNNEHKHVGWGFENNADHENLEVLPAGIYGYIIRQVDGNGYSHKRDCPMTFLEMRVGPVNDDNATRTRVRYGLLMLNEPYFNGLRSQLFVSTGMKRRGEAAVEDWPSLPGKVGYCEIGVNTFVDSNGNERQANQIVKLLDYPSQQEHIEKLHNSALAHIPVETPAVIAPGNRIDEERVAQSNGHHEFDDSDMPF